LMANITHVEVGPGSDGGPNGKGHEFGHSNPRLEVRTEDLLSAIDEMSQHKRPICLDLGCGSGEMAIAMTLAGGTVTGVDDDKKIATIANKKVWNFFGDFFPGDRSKKREFRGDKKGRGRCKIYKNDATDLDNTGLYPKGQLIDFVNMGHLLQWLKPDDMIEFLGGLRREKMSPGGMISASVRAIEGHPELIRFFHERKEQGAHFPGFLRCQIKKTGERLEDFSGVAYPARRHERPGMWKKRTVGKNFPGAIDFGSRQFREVTVVQHFFDPDTIRRVFEEAGFVVSYACYSTKDTLLRGDDELSEALLERYLANPNGPLFVVIVARKSDPFAERTEDDEEEGDEVD